MVYVGPLDHLAWNDPEMDPGRVDEKFTSLSLQLIPDSVSYYVFQSISILSGDTEKEHQNRST